MATHNTIHRLSYIIFKWSCSSSIETLSFAAAASAAQRTEYLSVCMSVWPTVSRPNRLLRRYYSLKMDSLTHSIHTQYNINYIIIYVHNFTGSTTTTHNNRPASGGGGRRVVSGRYSDYQLYYYYYYRMTWSDHFYLLVELHQPGHASVSSLVSTIWHNWRGRSSDDLQRSLVFLNGPRTL